MVIDVNKIDPSRYQRRRYFDEDKLRELGVSIQQAKARRQTYTGCCPKKNSFERSLKRFLRMNLGESRWCGTGASLRFVKKCFKPREKAFGQQPVKPDPYLFIIIISPFTAYLLN
jgi:hypothetical protein